MTDQHTGTAAQERDELLADMSGSTGREHRVRGRHGRT
jgi:hypothetical protein